MKNKDIRKIQFGGWNRQKYKRIRQKVRAFYKKDYNIPNEIKFK